jgi:hypothetical protein
MKAGTAIAITLLCFGGWPHPAAAATDPPPFTASFSGTATVAGPTSIAFSGSGWATSMGPITTSGHNDATGVDMGCPGGSANDNIETLVDGAGAALTILSHDVGCPTGLLRFHGTGRWTVVGGTGRYTDATGQGTIVGNVDLLRGTFSMDLSGTIVFETTS